MAKYNLNNYTDKDGLGFPLNFRRGNPNPLDNSAVWNSYSKMETYAQTDPTAYVGQVLSLIETVDETTVVTVYSIQDEAGTLKKVGTSPVGDEGTITVAEDGTVSLYGIAGLALEREEEDGSKTAITYQPLYVNGKLTWVEPSATTVEGLAAEIEGLKTRLTAVETAVGNAESGLVKAIADEVTAREEADQANADAIKAVSDKIGTVTEGKTVAEMISDAQGAAATDATTKANKALDDAKAYADGLAGNYDAAGSAADALADAKEYADGLAGNYDAAGSAADALDDAKAYADGLAGNYDAKGSAEAAETAAKAYADGLAGNYDAAGSAADALTDAKEYADGLKEELQGNIDAKADSTTVEALNKSLTDEIARAKAAEEQNATAIERLTNGVSAEEIDGVNDLIEYVNTHGPEVKGMKEDIVANTEAIEAVSDKIGNVADDKTLVEMISDAQGAAAEDATSKANKALDDAKAYADGLAGNYDAAGSAADAEAAAKSHAETKATEALNAAKGYADGLAGNYDAAGSAAAAEKAAKDYADGLAGNYDAAGSAEAAETAAKAYADGLAGNYDAAGSAADALADAKEYADGLAGNYDAVGSAAAAEKAAKDYADGLAGNYDAAGSAEAAEAAAKEYADGLNEVMAGRVETLEKVGAEKNVIASVDTEQFAIDENRNLTLLEIAMGKVTGLQDALDGKVDKIDGYRLISSDEATKLEKLVLKEDGSVEVSGEVSASNVKELDSWITTNRDKVAGLLSAEDAAIIANVKNVEAGAEVNDIVAITIAGSENALPIVDRVVDIPAATAEQAGVVLSSTGENKVTVESDKTMEVKSLNVNRLTQTDGEYVVLNGGSSSTVI